MRSSSSQSLKLFNVWLNKGRLYQTSGQTYMYLFLRSCWGKILILTSFLGFLFHQSLSNLSILLSSKSSKILKSDEHFSNDKWQSLSILLIHFIYSVFQWTSLLKGYRKRCSTESISDNLQITVSQFQVPWKIHF